MLYEHVTLQISKIAIIKDFGCNELFHRFIKSDSILLKKSYQSSTGKYSATSKVLLLLRRDTLWMSFSFVAFPVDDFDQKISNEARLTFRISTFY